MKKLLALIITILMIICFSSCASNDKSGSSSDVYVDIIDDADPVSSSDDTSADTASQGELVDIISTTAVAYKNGSATNLYGAVEYQNNGSAPIVIKNAHFTFSGTANTVEKDFIPVFSENSIVKPGETSYAVLWVENADFSEDEEITLNAELNIASSSSERIDLGVKDLFLADNYPSFTTLYGKLYSSDTAGCSLNIIYVGFYDIENKFLGAWYFTKNALIELGDCKAFVEHMRALPINKLAESCLEMKAIAFGVQ